MILVLVVGAIVGILVEYAFSLDRKDWDDE
jgi:hypothetical protein